jgi:hypothetical protein
MLEAILHGMKSGATKPVDYNKVKGIIQRQEESPIAFYGRLEVLMKYTSLDLKSVKGTALLNHHFVNQSPSYIRKKLQKLHLGPLTNKTQLLDITFQVFNNHDLEEKGIE